MRPSTHHGDDDDMVVVYFEGRVCSAAGLSPRFGMLADLGDIPDLANAGALVSR